MRRSLQSRHRRRWTACGRASRSPARVWSVSHSLRKPTQCRPLRPIVTSRKPPSLPTPSRKCADRPRLPYKKIAVLYRGHFQREAIVAELTRRGIPIKVKGANLFNTPELRDAMAVLRIIDASHPVALFRVAALPKFHIEAKRFRDELALLGRDFSAEAALEKVPGGPDVLKTIRQAQTELAEANGELTAAMQIAQRVFRLPDSMPLRRLHDFAKRWSEKPKQIVDQGTLHDFLEYLLVFQNEAGGSLVEESRR